MWPTSGRESVENLPEPRSMKFASCPLLLSAMAVPRKSYKYCAKAMDTAQIIRSKTNRHVNFTVILLNDPLAFGKATLRKIHS